MDVVSLKIVAGAEPSGPKPRVLVTLPENPRSTPRVGVVLAHGSRSGPEHPLLSLLASALANRDVIVFRFKFPYRAERRAFPDPEPVLRRALYSVAAEARRFLARGGVLLVGGRSLGARIASLEAADTGTWFADALVLAAYPLRPGGRHDPRRIAHWPRLSVPTLFVTGLSDPLAPKAALTTAQRALPIRAENLWIPGAGHEIAESRNDAGRARAEKIAARIFEFAKSLQAKVPPPALPKHGRRRD